MKRVSVITLQNIKNYGSMLQAYATQEILKQHGFEPEIVEYTRPVALFWNHILAYTANDNIIVRIIKILILLPTEIRYSLLWHSFKRKHLNLSERSFVNNEELKANPPLADLYCSGSDQVWNSGWNGGLLREFFLDYVPEGKKKYSLASSIGTSQFNDSEKPILSELLRKYSAISVREKSGKEMLEDLGLKNVTVLIDPTLTLDAAFWTQLSSNRKSKEPYILIYQLGKDARVEQYARYMQAITGYEVVRICIRYDYVFRYGKAKLIPSFNDFLSLFANAGYVITDSFHATCFSINFNREFWCILPGMYGGRIVDLLRLIGHEERIVPEDFSKMDVLAKIDYGQVNAIIEKERARVHEYYSTIA